MLNQADSAGQLAFRDKEQIYEAIPAWAKPSVNKAAETGIIIVGDLPD
ncbi:hypothetical protein J4772_28590 [Cohnella sp. LGH]|nr:hypothetical protein [Cohnella sp. LGH]QTH41464.1 hypothetical protein J4772_28590 [Cohnella sp. LGH]